MAHLMRRAGFGADRDELERRVANGYEATVEELLDPEANGIPPLDTDELFRMTPGFKVPANPENMSGYWMYRFINTPRPLEEKVALFWHHIFATANSKVNSPLEMTLQIDMFRDLGMGPYRTMLVEIAKNPAMIFWLDNNENHKDTPNENWGRELLELFSMGQGNYTEDDVKECARAFTGWTIGPTLPGVLYNRFPWEFKYDADDHDDGEKMFLGQRGRFNGEDVIDIILKHPATPGSLHVISTTSSSPTKFRCPAGRTSRPGIPRPSPFFATSWSLPTTTSGKPSACCSNPISSKTRASGSRKLRVPQNSSSAP